MYTSTQSSLTLILFVCFFLKTHFAFETLENDHTPIKDTSPGAKDKILLKDVKTLNFYRNRRTTSRKTHSIHQLSCVGGTAGCRLFTPNLVECENTGYNQEKSKYNWRCHADISNKVVFNHVEVICEGYDYPEDDYILVGSCGLEFTLDYADPHDYHHNSYFKHMDEHEKKMHQEKARVPVKPKLTKQAHTYWSFLEQLLINISNHVFLIGTFLVLAACSIMIVKFLAIGSPMKSSRMSSRGSSYNTLTSAVLTTKKAC